MYDISHDDWYKDISHLIGKVKLKFQQDFQSRNCWKYAPYVLSICNALSYLDACELINLISLDSYLYLLCCCT